ncbi:MAG: RNA polymerase sigma factor, partial [Bacteroidetes bacterium]|nr:RNA polymerase sigma factor [Bacteroidota bacterium]
MPVNYCNHTDQDLFKAFGKSGREKDDAFRELYSRYERKVYAFCLRLTGNPNDAGDVFQETFTRFYRHAQKPDEQINNMLAYLLTTARNVFL